MRILLLNQNHIGDALFTTPAIAALRAALPDAHIVNAVVRGVEPVFAANPNVTANRPRPTASTLDYLRFMFQVRRFRPDAVLSFSASSTLFGIYARFSGAPIRIGFDHRASRRYLTHALTLHDTGRHHVQDHLDQVAVLADVPRDLPMEMRLLPPWRQQAEEAMARLALPPDRPLVGLNPGATMDRKKWPVDRWASLADLLFQAGLQPILFGGPGDGPLVESIRSLSRKPPPSTQGLFTLGGLAAAAERCDVFVSGDTGPMHVAVAVGTPVVALHGPTDPGRTGPYTDRAIVLHHPEPNLPPEVYGRMETVTVDEVFQAALDSSVCVHDPDKGTDRRRR